MDREQKIKFIKENDTLYAKISFDDFTCEHIEIIVARIIMDKKYQEQKLNSMHYRNSLN